MKKECECQYCKGEVDEYFCFSCGLNFNECESFHKYDEITLCQKCHDETSTFFKEYFSYETYEKNKYNVFKKILKDLEIE